MNTAELKKLAEAASLTGAQLVGMSAPEFAEAQRLKQQFRQIRPEAILKLLAINTELVEALNWYAEQARLCRLIHSEGDSGRKALDADGGQKARDALAKYEGGEL